MLAKKATLMGLLCVGAMLSAPAVVLAGGNIELLIQPGLDVQLGNRFVRYLGDLIDEGWNPHVYAVPSSTTPEQLRAYLRGEV